MMITIKEYRDGNPRVDREWQAADIVEAANLVNWRNGGWTAPYQLNAENCDDPAVYGLWAIDGGLPQASCPPVEEAAEDFIRDYYMSNARWCVIEESV